MPAYHIRIALHSKSSSSQENSPTFVPQSLWQALPAHSAKQTTRKSALYRSDNKDYRLGPIRVDWMDLDVSTNSGIANGVNAKAVGGKERVAQGGGPATAQFVPHPPSSSRTRMGFTNLPEGIVHIYRDSGMRNTGKATTSAEASTSPRNDSILTHMDAKNEIISVDEDGIMLGVLAVPSWMTPSDFLAYVAPAAQGMSHIRMIRDTAPNRSIVLIKFRQVEDAADFIEAYNGRPFNSMEPESCHVVQVASLRIDPEDNLSSQITRLGTPHSNMIELPTCPVCLERMDSAITGLVTVPCSHTFHCMCLSKWGDSRCPVCRYSQTHHNAVATTSTSSSFPALPSSSSGANVSACASCNSTTNLWICLICGNIGCGRYGRAHAQAHYELTTHLYALELETQRVWDYAGDGYVHRLIRNKADGKVVELPSASMSSHARGEGRGAGPSEEDRISAEKIEAIGIEYSYLLTSQLDSQRQYYEEQIEGLKGEVRQLTELVKQMGQQTQAAREEDKEREEARRREEDEIRRDKIRAEKRAEKMSEVARGLERELREERAVSEGLMKNLEKTREKVKANEQEEEKWKERVKELEDQVRDVMFFLEARTKIESGEGPVSEAAGGSLELPPSASSSPVPGSKKKKNTKK